MDVELISCSDKKHDFVKHYRRWEIINWSRVCVRRVVKTKVKPKIEKLADVIEVFIAYSRLNN